jgi:excisionase family DNA binding protein
VSGILNSPLVLIEDVAAELGVSPTTLREWCRKRQFPHIKHGGKRRIWLRRDWIDQWMVDPELEVLHKRGGGRVVRPKAVKQ